METNLSDYVSAGVLSQKGEDRNLHLVVYFSERMISAECNYKIYNKELLAIIQCFKEWRPELKGTAMSIKVLTDHKGLEHFMTTKKLISSQTRWTEFLSKFNFVVTYQTKKKNNKADALTRKPHERPVDDKNNWQEHRMQMLLLSKRIEMQPIEVTDQHKNVEAEHKENEPHVELHTEHKETGTKKITDNSEKVTYDSKKVTHELPILLDWVKELNQENKLFTKVCEYLANLAGQNRLCVYLWGSKVNNSLLYKENTLWVAKDLHLDVMQKVHDQPAVRYAETKRTILMIQQHYFWPKMKRDVERYIRNHHICKR